eukprot:10497684-Alexandrium_andersonii.AAC.1
MLVTLEKLQKSDVKLDGTDEEWLQWLVGIHAVTKAVWEHILKHNGYSDDEVKKKSKPQLVKMLIEKVADQ